MTGKDLYYDKYLKYKNKYLNLKDQIGGVITDIEKFEYEQLEEVTFPNIQAGNEDEILTILEYLKINKNLKRLRFTNISQILDNQLFEPVLLPDLRSIGINKQITHLNFSGNKHQNIQLENRHMENLAKMLTFYEHLKHIDLTNNNITIEGFNQLIGTLTDVEFNKISTLKFKKDIRVDFIGNPIIDTRGLDFRSILQQEQNLIRLVRNNLGIILRLR